MKIKKPQKKQKQFLEDLNTIPDEIKDKKFKEMIYLMKLRNVIYNEK